MIRELNNTFTLLEADGEAGEDKVVQVISSSDNREVNSGQHVESFIKHRFFHILLISKKISCVYLFYLSHAIL